MEKNLKQQKMSKPLMIIGMVVLLLILSGLALYFIGYIFNLKGDYSAIEIVDGSTGNIVHVENSEDIQDFINEINQMKFQKYSTSEVAMGYRYHINFYKKKGMDKYITVMDNHSFKKGIWEFKSEDDIIEYIEPMFDIYN